MSTPNTTNRIINVVTKNSFPVSIVFSLGFKIRRILIGRGVTELKATSKKSKIE